MKVLYPLAKRFIAGYDFDSAKSTIKRLMDEGYQVSIDYIGENNKNIEQVKKAYKQYIEIIEYFKEQKIDISIKPSQLGLSISPYLSYILIKKITKEAAKYNHTIRLDMEDSKVTVYTRNLAIALHTSFGNVGVAIQANLFRTKDDLKHLMEFEVPVRLVKGAYKENSSIAYQNNEDIKGNFFDCAAFLRSERANKPAIATHDELLLDDVRELIPSSKVYFDYEFLYGIRRDLQKSLKDEGSRVRIYVPFGTAWLPYTIRRLREWKNLKFVIKNMFKEWF
tara:strand:- start:571 stop:1410 length:840 start_codon:yes stop_codon:yes gene_type:complete